MPSVKVLDFEELAVGMFVSILGPMDCPPLEEDNEIENPDARAIDAQIRAMQQKFLQVFSQEGKNMASLKGHPFKVQALAFPYLSVKCACHHEPLSLDVREVKLMRLSDEFVRSLEPKPWWRRLLGQ